jgi:ABC-2 type transport system permease protein
MIEIGPPARTVVALGRRGLSTQFRRAQLLMPTFVLPLMLLAIIASGTGAARDLRGFPTIESYLSFVVPGTIIQGALLIGLTTGTAIASDIEFGFFDRLLAAPVPRWTLVVGRLAGTLPLALLQSVFFLTVALIFGARYGGSPLAVIGVLVLAPLTAAGIGGLAATIAIRTGSMSLMQGIFPLVFVLLFTSPAFFPRDLLTPTLQDVAAFNPLTFIVEAVRRLLTGTPTGGPAWHGFASAVGLVMASTGLATLALRDRLRRL